MANMDTKKLGTIAWDLIIWKLSDPGTLINLGWVKTLDVTVDTDAERVEIAAHNRAAITGNSPAGIIGVQFLENIDAEKISVLTGATVSVTAGTEVNVLTEALGTGWVVGQPIKLANNMGDNTIVINIIIDADATPLVAGTDYEAFVDASGDTYILPLTVQAGVLDADYDYTPNSSVTVRNTRKYQNDVLLGAKIVTDADADGKVNTYTLESCIFKGQYKISVLDLAIAGDLDGTTGALELSRGSDIVHNIETL